MRNIFGAVETNDRALGIPLGSDRTYYQDATGNVSKKKPATIKRTVRARSIREAIARCNMETAREVAETRKDRSFERERTGTLAQALLETFGSRALRVAIEAE